MRTRGEMRYIVADENTAGRYDVLPTATAANGWSFMGGIDRAWVLLNLEDKTNRNCKWVFELVSEDPVGIDTIGALVDLIEKAKRGEATLDEIESLADRILIYDLAGRRVRRLAPGSVYVVGGKRVVF